MMIGERGSAVPLVLLWISVALGGILLGWLLNSAYFSLLSETSRSIVNSLSVSPSRYPENIVPTTERVFQIYIIAQAVVAAVCVALSFLPSASHAKRRMVVLLCAGVSLPVIFYLVAVTSRYLTERGVIGSSAIEGLALAPDQTARVGGYEYSSGYSGPAVRNLLDSRSVLALLFDHAYSLWVNYAALAVVSALLCACLLARLLWVWRASRGSSQDTPSSKLAT